MRGYFPSSRHGNFSEPRQKLYIDLDGFLRFGKHNGDHVKHVARMDSGYLHWMLDTLELNEEQVEQIEEAREFVRNGGTYGD